jgi:hypothetical protein
MKPTDKEIAEIKTMGLSSEIYARTRTKSSHEEIIDALSSGYFEKSNNGLDAYYNARQIGSHKQLMNYIKLGYKTDRFSKETEYQDARIKKGIEIIKANIKNSKE